MTDLQSFPGPPHGQSEQEDTSSQQSRLPDGCRQPTAIHPDLARLADLWPILPVHVRQAILTLAEGCG
jgi:hypothetical protein